MNEEFESLDLSLSIRKEDWLLLAKATIRSKFDPASASIFEEATQRNVKGKLWEALRNEILVDAVKEIVNRGGAYEQQVNTEASQGETQKDQTVPLGQGSNQ